MPDRDDLHHALRALPALRAGEGFTEEVLARLDRSAGRTPHGPRPRRLLHLALTATAGAALAAAVGLDGMWPPGPWLRFGGDSDAGVGKGGAAVAPAEAGASSRDTGAPGRVHPGPGTSTPAAEPPRARAVAGSEAGPAARRGPGRSTRPERPAPRRSAPTPAADAGPDASADVRPAAVPIPSPGTEPGREEWAEQADAAARLAVLRYQRELLLADLRALRSAVPPPQPAGLLLSGGESVDLVLGLGPALTAERATRSDGPRARPAILRLDDRPPRFY